MDTLRLLTKNNVFQFGDTYWLQKLGTAMGAPPDPPWVKIFFSIHEEAMLAQFGDTLQLYCRFINNVLGIWLDDPDPAKDHQKMNCIYIAIARLLRPRMDLQRTFKEGELYGYDDINPQGLDCYITL